MSEISDFALLLLPVAAGLALAILSMRLPLPAPGLFLLAAALVPGDPLGTQAVERIAVVALVVILLNGGMDIGWARMRRSVNPVMSLGVLGTFLTAGLIAVVAHAVLGFSWTLAGIVGAALAPTDPAVVFSVLGGTRIRGRAGTILEGEAGVNDPAGIALMLGMIELATHDDATLLNVVSDFGIEMAVGVALGFLGARVLAPFVRLGSEQMRPVLLLALAVVLYAVTSLAHGSGFLAVFVAGLVLGDDDLRVQGFTQPLAGLAEIVVFVTLGLTIDLTGLPASAWRDGAILTLALVFAIRPIVVAITLAQARLEPGDRAFVAWSGLKGAVPILLAAFAVLDGVEGAETVYGIVFVAVLFSVFGQGGLVPAVARRVLRT
ncbi:cation:proton antiporter domain-containing protein [Candidatus Solirubrobacter pratensis]|uniref:cation:proton antiporter domain-containing protein n=1 Tax=Candidatus Solirubrobacter pratensis TaxID=1298857 RepID=UPI0003FE7D2B|nr:cation:proton antiporter [Candidatus Solirubrobacter pratensis]